MPPAPDTSETFPAGQRFYRVHRASNGAAYFDTSPDGRFNPPPPLLHEFGTLYLATSPEGAFVETLGRTRHLEQTAIDERRLTTCSFHRQLHMFRVHGRANRFRYAGLDLAHDAVATAPDYGTSQHLAGLVWADPDGSFDGLSYRARHDNAQLLTSLAAFGEPGSHQDSNIFADHKTEAIPEDLVRTMVADFGFEIIPAAPLP